MEKETIKENIEKISGVEKVVNEIKALLFSTEKKEEAKVEAPVATEQVVEPAKVEFNAEAAITEFKVSIADAFKSYEEKFSAFELQIKTANDTIVKQEDTLKKVFSLVETLIEKVNTVPTGMAKQPKKEGVKLPVVDHLSKEELEKFRNLK